MNKKSIKSCVLTIAGYDPSGGAGVVVDSKVIQKLNNKKNINQNYGLHIITSIVSQNHDKVNHISTVGLKTFKSSINALIKSKKYKIQAIKIGVVYNKSIAKEIIKTLSHPEIKKCPIIIDPLLISSSGKKLIKKTSQDYFIKKLFPLGTLLTPNLKEAEFLLKTKIRTKHEFDKSVIKLAKIFKTNILLKGGHFLGYKNKSIDIFYENSNNKIIKLINPRIYTNTKSKKINQTNDDFELDQTTNKINLNLHGTGCVYSTSIAYFLATGDKLKKSVMKSNKFLNNLIKESKQLNDTNINILI